MPARWRRHRSRWGGPEAATYQGALPCMKRKWPQIQRFATKSVATPCRRAGPPSQTWDGNKTRPVPADMGAEFCCGNIGAESESCATVSATQQHYLPILRQTSPTVSQLRSRNARFDRMPGRCQRWRHCLREACTCDRDIVAPLSSRGRGFASWRRRRRPRRWADRSAWDYRRPQPEVLRRAGAWRSAQAWSVKCWAEPHCCSRRAWPRYPQPRCSRRSRQQRLGSARRSHRGRQPIAFQLHVRSRGVALSARIAPTLRAYQSHVRPSKKRTPWTVVWHRLDGKVGGEPTTVKRLGTPAW